MLIKDTWGHMSAFTVLLLSNFLVSYYHLLLAFFTRITWIDYLLTTHPSLSFILAFRHFIYFYYLQGILGLFDQTEQEWPGLHFKSHKVSPHTGLTISQSFPPPPYPTTHILFIVNHSPREMVFFLQCFRYSQSLSSSFIPPSNWNPGHGIISI